MLKHSALITVLLVSIIITSGCINIDPETLAMTHPIVNQFMREHPNADLKIVHYTINESVGIIDRIREDCGKDTIEPKEFYFVNITDEGFNAIAWIDWENQIVECAYKTTTESPTECVSKAKALCYGNHVYWFDSCGNKGDKKEFCNNGCMNGLCLKDQEQCKSRAEHKCYGEHVYWFDSCGHKQDKKEFCNYGCNNGFCKNKTITGGDSDDNDYNTCADSDGGKNYYVKGTVISGTQALSDHCSSDGTLTEKFCYDGDILWETYNCPDGCVDGACINLTNETCTQHAYYDCFGGNVYWFDSCNNTEERKENCSYGCDNGVCLEESGNETNQTILLLHFNECSGNTVYDSSGNGHNGSIYESNWTEGISGCGLNFDGIDDYVHLNDHVDFNSSQFTLETWFKADSITGDNPLVNRNMLDKFVYGGDDNAGPSYGFGIGYGWNGKLRVFVGRGDFISTAQVAMEDSPMTIPNVWYHLVGTYDGTTLKLYLNGSLIASKETIYTPSSVNLALGMDPAGAEYFNGTLDELRISNYAKSQEEIMESYLEYT